MTTSLTYRQVLADILRGEVEQRGDATVDALQARHRGIPRPLLVRALFDLSAENVVALRYDHGELVSAHFSGEGA